MPATPAENLARAPVVLAAFASLLMGAAVTACAAGPEPASAPPTPSRQAEPAVRMDAAQSGAAYEPPPPAPPAAEGLAELEASLAAYEQQLAQNESRLRGLGVRIATGPGEPRPDDRFAAPPPPSPMRPGERPTGGTARKSNEEADDKAKKREPTAKPSAAAPGYGDVGAGRASPSKAAGARAPEAKDEQGRGRCEELCELASATCELEAKICDLASRHVDEPHYGEVCQRAGADCRIAGEACTACSP